MRVSTLQQYLRNLSGPLEASGASKKILEDLDKTCRALEPFKDSDLESVALLLTQADEYRRTGTLPFPPKKPRKPPAPKAPPPPPSEAILKLAQQVRALEEKATDPEVNREMLIADLNRLDLDELSKNDVIALAREVGVVVRAKTTAAAAVDGIRSIVLERKEALESLKV